MIRSASGKENEIIGLRFAGDRFFFFIAETTGNERGRSPLLSAPVRRRQEETGTAVAEIFARQHRRGPDRQMQRSETRKQAATTAITAVGEKAGATGTAGAGPGLRSDRQPERGVTRARGYRNDRLPERQARKIRLPGSIAKQTQKVRLRNAAGPVARRCGTARTVSISAPLRRKPREPRHGTRPAASCRRRASAPNPRSRSDPLRRAS